MALALKDLLKRTEGKGFEKIKSPSSTSNYLLAPWQQESVLFNKNKLENTNQGTIREQSGNELGTIREQLADKLDNKQRTKKETNREQKENKSGNILDNESGNDRIKLELTRLNGIQLKLFIYALNLCMLREDGTTGFILTKHMSVTIDCSYESVKISLKRLIAKGLIARGKGKTSRGGFIILSIPKEVKTLAIQLKLLGNNSGDELENKSGTTDSHYNNSNKNIITIGEGWDEVDFSYLESIGFRKNHLLQIKKFTTPELAQESINHFAFALENNEKVRKYETPLNVFMSVLKRGEAWVEANYESPLERAQRLQLERRRAEQERIQKLKDEIFKIEYDAWRKNITEDKICEMSPTALGREMKIRHYFIENVWPEIKKNLEK